MAWVDLGRVHVGLEAEPLTHRRHLLLIYGVCVARTFARLTGFSTNNEHTEERQN